MLVTLKKIWDVFAPEEKHRALSRLLLVVLMGMVEAASVLSIMPFLSVLGRPAVIHEVPTLSWAFQLLGFS